MFEPFSRRFCIALNVENSEMETIVFRLGIPFILYIYTSLDLSSSYNRKWWVKYMNSESGRDLELFYYPEGKEFVWYIWVPADDGIPVAKWRSGTWSYIEWRYGPQWAIEATLDSGVESVMIPADPGYDAESCDVFWKKYCHIHFNGRTELDIARVKETQCFFNFKFTGISVPIQEPVDNGSVSVFTSHTCAHTTIEAALTDLLTVIRKRRLTQ